MKIAIYIALAAVAVLTIMKAHRFLNEDEPGDVWHEEE